MAGYTLGIGAALRETKQRSSKSLQTASLCYSNAKSTVKVPLTFNKVEKTKVENFDFVHLLSSSTRIAQKVYGLCEF